MAEADEDTAPVLEGRSVVGDESDDRVEVGECLLVLAALSQHRAAKAERPGEARVEPDGFVELGERLFVLTEPGEGLAPPGESSRMCRVAAKGLVVTRDRLLQPREREEGVAPAGEPARAVWVGPDRAVVRVERLRLVAPAMVGLAEAAIDSSETLRIPVEPYGVEADCSVEGVEGFDGPAEH